MTDAAGPAPNEPNPAPLTSASTGMIEPLTKGYRQYALGMLLVVYTLNFLDRQVVNILAEPIKRDLGLADWQLGMMTGLAFALFYTFLGIPIARKAERSHRPFIIAISIAVWSGFTVLCGFAQNFWQLILFRIGVGVGEAGCTPPSHSLITDYVPREMRASAIAFYSIGTPLGSLIGLAMGGLIADAYGWRMAFIVAGAPGVIVAIIAALTLVEPRRKLAADLAARAAAPAISFGAALAVLMSKKTFWLIAFAAAIKAFIGYGHAPFTASFFFRNHGPQLVELAAWLSDAMNRTFSVLPGLADINIKLGVTGFLGIALSAVGGTAGVFGAWLGGYIADRLGAKDLRAYVVVPAIASVITIPIYILGVTVGDAGAAVLILAIPAILGTLWYGPVYATAQSIVEPHMRATCAAILLFIINLVGLGLGPLAVGILSDVFAGPLGMGEAEGVRWALISSTMIGLVAFLLFWMARKTIREEMVS
jgi:MFS family permease